MNSPCPSQKGANVMLGSLPVKTLGLPIAVRGGLGAGASTHGPGPGSGSGGEVGKRRGQADSGGTGTWSGSGSGSGSGRKTVEVGAQETGGVVDGGDGDGGKGRLRKRAACHPPTRASMVAHPNDN